jgi:hypothetical protein
MNPEDISKFIHGCEIGDLKGADFDGHIGILMMYHFLSKSALDVSKFARDNKFNYETCMAIADRFAVNGFMQSSNWVCKSRNSMLSVLKHKSKISVKDWCYVAGVASGYTGK